MVRKRSPRRDDAVDKVRTIYWFQYLGACIGSFHPRDVQRAISSMPKIDANGGLIKNNKFLGYSRGDHVPNAALVQRAAATYPVSTYILNHVIWQVLRDDGAVEKRARLWIGQLDPDIQKAVVKPGNEFRDGTYTHDMLLRRFSLDSLAALTILFRLNHEKEEAKSDPTSPSAYQAWSYALGIFRVLMMMESQFLTDEVRTHIFELFSQRVFSLVSSFWGMRMDLENYDYPKMSSLLRKEANDLRIYMRPPLNREELYRITTLIEIPLVRLNPV